MGIGYLLKDVNLTEGKSMSLERDLCVTQEQHLDHVFGKKAQGDEPQVIRVANPLRDETPESRRAIYAALENIIG